MEKLTDELLSMQGHIQTQSRSVRTVTSLAYQENNVEKGNISLLQYLRNVFDWWQSHVTDKAKKTYNNEIRGLIQH